MDKKRIQGLVRELDALKADADEPLASIKESLAEAKDDGLHVAAFKLAWKLSRKDAPERNAFLAAFDEYRTALALDREPGLQLAG